MDSIVLQMIKCMSKGGYRWNNFTDFIRKKFFTQKLEEKVLFCCIFKPYRHIEWRKNVGYIWFLFASTCVAPVQQEKKTERRKAFEQTCLFSEKRRTERF